MSKVVTIAQTNINGVLNFIDIQALMEEFVDMPNKTFEVTFSPIGGKITDEQRAYWFCVVNKMICDFLRESGYEITLNQCHQWNKAQSPVMYENVYVLDELGNPEMCSIPIEFKTASKEVISGFIDERIRFASTVLGLYIRPPVVN